jgi:hypothetical protein
MSVGEAGHRIGEYSAGAEASLIDVRIPTGSMGIFDRLPKRTAPESSAILAAGLRHHATRSYGRAGKEFIKALVSDVTADKAMFQDCVDRRMRRFLKRIDVSENDLYLRPAAGQFALAYAAGLLAIDYGVVPWSCGLVFSAVRRLYRQTARARGNGGQAVTAATKLLARLPTLAKSAPDLADRSQAIDPDAAMLQLLHSDGTPLLAIRPEAFRTLVGSSVSEQAVAAELETRGVLIPRGNGRRTRQLRLPGVKARRGYYCLRLSSAQSSLSTA